MSRSGKTKVDGFVEVTMSDPCGPGRFWLRSNHALIRPYLPDGMLDILAEDGTKVADLFIAHQESTPTCFAEVVVAAPPALDLDDPRARETLADLPKPGDTIVFERYASQQLYTFAFDTPFDDSLPMARTNRGLHIINLADAVAVIPA